MSTTLEQLEYDNPHFSRYEYRGTAIEQHGTADNAQIMTHYCGYCGLWHQGPCPRIKAIEYYPNGTIKRIEYREE